MTTLTGPDGVCLHIAYAPDAPPAPAAAPELGVAALLPPPPPPPRTSAITNFVPVVGV
ncbi:hypothetical protein D3C71_2168840 [compost metagenome]